MLISLVVGSLLCSSLAVAAPSSTYSNTPQDGDGTLPKVDLGYEVHRASSFNVCPHCFDVT